MRVYLTFAEASPDSIFKFKNNEYFQSELLKAIEKEEARGGSGASSSQGGDPGGGGAGGSGGNRKTKHCVHRLCSCMMLEQHRNPIQAGFSHVGLGLVRKWGKKQPRGFRVILRPVIYRLKSPCKSPELWYVVGT